MSTEETLQWVKRELKRKSITYRQTGKINKNLARAIQILRLNYKVLKKLVK